MSKLVNLLINPALALLFAAGLMVFIYGLIEFLWALNTQGEGREKGKQHMLWGVVGMFIMTAAWTIMKIIAATVGGSVSNC